jgi:hypothetical protein
MVVKIKGCALTEHHAMKSCWGSWGIAPRIDLGIRWKLVVSFTPRLFYTRGKSHWYPLDRRVLGPREGLDTWWGEKFPAPAGTRTPDQHHISRNIRLTFGTQPPRLKLCDVVEVIASKYWDTKMNRKVLCIKYGNMTSADLCPRACISSI